MNSFAVVFLAALACANAGLLAAPGARVLQGPSSSATIVGPDGSAISSIAPGGTVVADSAPGIVAAAAPVVAAAPAVVARSAWAAPAAAWAAPAAAWAAPAAAWTAPAAAWAAPAAWAGSGLVARSAVLGNTVVAGPSGTITAAGPLAAPLAAAVW